MLTERGWAAVAAALAAVVLGFLSLSPLLLFSTLALFLYLVTEIVAFHVWVAPLTPRDFEVVRTQLPARLSAGAELEQGVEVTYRGRRRCLGELEDGLPATVALASGRPGTGTTFSTGGAVRLRYRVRFEDRGVARFGPVRATAWGSHRLCFRDQLLPSFAETLVLPPLPVATPRTAGPPALAKLGSGRLVRMRGYGTDVRSLRPYLPSDDVRDIAWRKSTLEHLVVREYEREGRREFLLAVDLSPAMDAGPAGESALDLAAECGRLVSHLVGRSDDDHLGLLGFSDGVVAFVPGGRGPSHFARLTTELAEMKTRPGSFGFSAVCDALGERLRRRTHVLAFSTSGDLGASPKSSYRRLVARGHRIAVLAPEIARLHLRPSSPRSSGALAWAEGEARRELDRNLAQLRSLGVPTHRFHRGNATRTVVTAYAKGRGDRGLG